MVGDVSRHVDRVGNYHAILQPLQAVTLRIKNDSFFRTLFKVQKEHDDHAEGECHQRAVEGEGEAFGRFFQEGLQPTIGS